MTKPRCVLCGEELRATMGANFLREMAWRVWHNCNSGGYPSQNKAGHKHEFYSPFAETKAAALAAIPSRFLMKENE